MRANETERLAAQSIKRASRDMRDADIIQARSAGLTFKQIGGLFGVSTGRAQQAYLGAMYRRRGRE